MRLPRRILPCLLAFFALTGCAYPDSEVVTEPDSPPPSPVAATPAPPPAVKRPQAEPPAVVTPATEGASAEVVYVFMRGHDRSGWMCTGTLVGPRTVVTAAHCLDPAAFASYEIVAPLVAGKPRVSASKPRIFGGSYEAVENPDIGWLTLDEAIALPAYAELTDVVARVDAGEALEAAAVVRTSELPEAPLVETSAMPLASGVPLGYQHGFTLPLFSKGGDSGAGVFLVEGGKRTHKLIGVARQPEPERSLDHLTRIDAAFLAFYAENRSN